VRVPVRDEAGYRWILIVSLSPGGPTGGSGTQFFVGSFDGHRFTSDGAGPRWLDHGHDYYAAVSFNDAPGNAAITIGWASSWHYAETVPTHPWRSAMSFARTLELVRSDDGDLVLHQTPATPRPGVVIEHHVTLKPGGRVLLHAAPGLGSSEVELTVDRDSGVVIVDRSHCGPALLGDHFTSPASAPLPLGRDEIELRIVVDASILEIYVDETTTFTEQIFPDAALTHLTVTQG
jgi:fructan beta-fructosidase